MDWNKIIRIILIVVAIAALVLTAFVYALEPRSNSTIAVEEELESFKIHPDTIGFEAVYSHREDGTLYQYFRERSTNTMYVWMDAQSRYGKAGFSAMLDPETGGALTYNSWLKYLSEQNGTITCPNCGAIANTDFCFGCNTSLKGTN